MNDAKINVAYSIPGSGNSGAWHYPDNYPTGFEVTSTDWMDFEATITARENIGGASYWEVLFGFYNGTTEGSKVEIDMTSLYFVPYKACDILCFATLLLRGPIFLRGEEPPLNLRCLLFLKCEIHRLVILR